MKRDSFLSISDHKENLTKIEWNYAVKVASRHENYEFYNIRVEQITYKKDRQAISIFFENVTKHVKKIEMIKKSIQR